MHTEVFDGPLELLLFLVRREGVDLRDLPISPIADGFLAHLRAWESMDLDVASEFLLMAATLCWLKSRELLPHSVADDEQQEDDPDMVRDQLARRLLDYQRYKDAADALSARAWLGRDCWAPVPQPVQGSDRPLVAGTDALGMLEVYYDVLQRHVEPPAVHHVTLEHYSLEEMAGWILGRLHQGPRELSDLLSQLDHKTDRVVAFLASLEMGRLQLLDIQQASHLGAIVLRGRISRDEADLTALSEGVA